MKMSGVITITTDFGHQGPFMPIIIQACVPVRADDTVDSLSARILVEEHRIYPEAVRLMLADGWRVAGRRFIAVR